ncbi:MAG: hypothetical protein ACMG55_00805 [Microcoleus sp.]
MTAHRFFCYAEFISSSDRAEAKSDADAVEATIGEAKIDFNLR